ncbi:MAG TPA: hypothetical protein VFJ43_11365, partial [Bacteroidia bacterium]|nr:hypothetical protein [Bacteroidia bacterium]
MKNDSDIAVLVLSCDKYSDAWNPFFKLFRKYWPTCPFPVYLGTNESGFDFAGVNILHSGKALDWSSDTIAILGQIPQDYIILLLEDYFLEKPVDEEWLNECIRFTKEKNASFMRIASFRKDHFSMYAFDETKENAKFGISRPDAPYRINLQAGIWNRTDFLQLITKGESPWEFEVNGSVRSVSSSKPVLGITEASGSDVIAGPIPYLCTAITKGTWMREAIELCKKENIELDLKSRSVESGFA